MPLTPEAEWTREALRLCDRYLREVVLAFQLCPWAEPALRANRVGKSVCLQTVPAAADCLPFLDGWGRASAPAVEIGLLLFPRYQGSSAAFDGFAERVRRAADHQARSASAGPAEAAGAPARSPFLVAAFHPGGASTFVGPSQLISFLRRTPDPMLQFVRADIIDRVRDEQPGISETIADHNHQALVGSSHRLDAVVRQIHDDRAVTYARLSSGADPA